MSSSLKVLSEACRSFGSGTPRTDARGALRACAQLGDCVECPEATRASTSSLGFEGGIQLSCDSEFRRELGAIRQNFGALQFEPFAMGLAAVQMQSRRKMMKTILQESELVRPVDAFSAVSIPKTMVA